MNVENFMTQLEKKILSYMVDNKDIKVFALADFESFGTYDAVRKALSRLYQKELVLRVYDGVYQLVRFTKSVEEDPPLDDVAMAIARNNEWSIVPDTEYARYLLCLSHDEPKEKIFMSTGWSNTYVYGHGVKFRFRQVKGQYLKDMSYDAALVISALKDLDKHKLTIYEVYFLSTLISRETKENLLANIKSIPYKRIRPIIELICDDYGRIGR